MKTLQRTLTIVKPDAVRKNAIGDIIEQFEKGGFRILAMNFIRTVKHLLHKLRGNEVDAFAITHDQIARHHGDTADPHGHVNAR